MKAVLFVAIAAVARMRGYYAPPGLGGEDGVLLGFGYQPFVHVSGELVDEGTGWMAQLGWGMGGRAGAVVVAYEVSEHKALTTGETATYWRLDAGYGAYITEFPKAVAPYISCGASMHSVDWGPGPDEGYGGYGVYAGMGVDVLPSTHLFFGFDLTCHLWTDKYDQGYITVTATASAFIEF